MPSTVLLVEDQVDLADLWSEILQSSGWTVAHAASLAEARAHAAPVALAIVDWTLPDGTSEALVTELVARGARVIVTTGHSAPTALAATAAGASRVLQKPFTLRSLVAAAGAPFTDPSDSPPPS